MFIFCFFGGKNFSGRFGKILFPEKRKTCKEALGQGGSTSGPTLAPDVSNNEPSSTVAIDLLTFGENDEKKVYSRRLHA